MQSKKSIALVDYEICNPRKCNPDEGLCAAVLACSHKVLKQIDGHYCN
jgi:ATP-binding cassette subfamily E protein 1